MCTLEILYSQSSVSVFHLKRTEETKSNFELIFTAQFTSSICSSKSEKRSTLTLPGLRRIQEYSNLIFLKGKLITLMETEQWKIWTCEPKRLPWMHLFIHVAPCPERSFRKEKTDLEDKNKCIYLATNWIYASTCWTPCGANSYWCVMEPIKRPFPTTDVLFVRLKLVNPIALCSWKPFCSWAQKKKLRGLLFSCPFHMLVSFSSNNLDASQVKLAKSSEWEKLFTCVRRLATRRHSKKQPC